MGAEPALPIVLVVDDQPDEADSLALLLRLRGHEVHTAHDGPTAVEVARRVRPRVVFLDLGLPRMRGPKLPASCTGNWVRACSSRQ